MTLPRILFLPSCSSTNTELAAMADPPHGTVVATHTQTAGRGQRGNSWEAAPGENLTFSLLLRPQAIPPRRQFELSMIVSLAIVSALRQEGIQALIKWPNDIYTPDNRKLCGILIENSLGASGIERSIVGIGLNVNQTRFLSDAPNPVSMKNIDGLTRPLEPLLRRICSQILNTLTAYEASPAPDDLGREYFSLLWRADGSLYPFRDSASGAPFLAQIAAVDSDGTLSLKDSDSQIRKFLFKEVEFII